MNSEGFEELLTWVLPEDKSGEMEKQAKQPRGSAASVSGLFLTILLPPRSLGLTVQVKS